MEAPEGIPYQKGTDLSLEGYEVQQTEIMYEFHSEYLTENSYNPSGEDVEVEQVVAPPPPTEPELDDPTTFDPKVMGVWDYLLAEMTDEHKQKVKEQAAKEGVRTGVTTSDAGPLSSMLSSSGPTQESRGPSR